MFNHSKETKTRCLHCGAVMYGRADKKFCDSKCKNAHHNEENERSRKYRKKVMEALEVNYSILEELLKCRQLSANAEKLALLGFNSNYSTYHRRRYARDEYGCYDIRYNKSDSRIFNIHKVGSDIGEL